MAPFRKLKKSLTCHYCNNRKSSIPYDGRMRHFKCRNCGSDNYLDANGELTDPPVAKTTTQQAPRQYATRRGLSPTDTTTPTTSTSTTSSQIFCNKCLNNQHLFVASLAQYLPEDPNDPEYIERERGYYKFRRGLEKRYPQVCAECEPKVRDQLQKAAYTAKTDHLRRMLDRSKETRALTTRSAVNYCHSAGKWLWTASLLLQLMWHAYLIYQAVIAQRDGTNEKSWAMLTARVFGLFIAFMPTPDRIMRWSFWTTVLTIWWNPRWVECCKGFTRHLVGFANFYSYQALILALKLPGFFNMSLLPNYHASRLVVQIGAHASMAAFMLFLYNTGRKSIRVDHTPLWVPKASTVGAAPPPPAADESSQSREDSKRSMADILDEILHEPTSSPKPEVFMSKFSAADQFDHMPSISHKSSYNPSASIMSPNPFSNLNTGHSSTNFGLGNLSISDRTNSRAQQMVHYDENMEWSPTQSQHRAFSSYQPGQSQPRRFGETPTHERAGAFWAKIPPAPTNPAQRIFNPPNAPRIRTSPATTKETITFRGAGLTQRLSQPQPHAPPENIFANPSFVPPVPKDERDGLSELFTNSFTLTPKPKENTAPRAHALSHRNRIHMLTEKFKFLVLGLCLVVCLAVLANRASSYFPGLGGRYLPQGV